MEETGRILILLTVVYILVDVIQVPAEKITFTFFNGTRTWNEAYCICINYGMSLLVIDSEEKTDIFKMVQAQMGGLVTSDESIWIGLFNTVIFKWINGKILGNWPPLSKNKPKKISTDLCVKFSENKWKAKVCSDSYRFVCEAKQDLCSMESNYSSPSVLDVPAGIIISTEIQCVQQCEQNNTCYAVIHNHTTNECSVYNAVNNLDFVKSGNRTGIAYRKICYEGNVAEDDTGYINKGIIPQLTCTLTIASPIETISTISSMHVTDYLNLNESVPILTELYYLNEFIVSSSNPIIAFSPTMTFDSGYSPDIILGLNSFLSTPSVTLLSMAATSNYIMETNTIGTMKDLTSNALQNSQATTSFEIVPSSSTNFQSATSVTPVLDTAVNSPIIIMEDVASISSNALQSSQTKINFESVTSSSTNFQSATSVTPVLHATVNSTIIITPASSLKRIIPQNILSLCGCKCRPRSLGSKDDDTVKVIRNLSVAKNTTSSYRRQKTSANNTSFSSVFIGSFGLIVVAVVLGCILVSDAIMIRKRLCDRTGRL